MSEFSGTKVLRLSENIRGKGLVPFLASLDDCGNAESIILDFAALRRVSPAGLVVITARVSHWHSEGRRVFVDGLHDCAILAYLQRMDLLKACGIEMPEPFKRHDGKGRFVPVRLIDHRVDEMGSEMALCVAPGGDEWREPLAGPYDFVWYVLTEMANNVRQHSGGRGFASAQVGRGEGLVRMAIADNGWGILESFRSAGLPWSGGVDETGAILKALEPKVSSKGSPNNEGVGLTLTRQLAELAEAWLLSVSGSGVVQVNPVNNRSIYSGVLPNGGRYPGTLVALTFRQDRVADFAVLLDQAKRKSGLLHKPPGQGRFT
jgi:hypothetical protein